jgi:SAM-dependent methyltransferase
MPLGDFTDQAIAYRRARPDYPAELLEQLVVDAGVARGDPVADFGAGTGIFTRLLVERGFQVTALEPNESMRSLNDVPQGRWLNGTFENSGLADGSQAWAVAAQAFHWADPLRGLPEIRRILQPGRLLTVLWNNRADRDNELLAWTDDAIHRHVPEFDEAYRNRDWSGVLESTGDFRFVNRRMVRHMIAMSRERYLDLWRSHNRLNSIAGPARFAAFFQELSEHLARQSIEQIEVPYHCEAWSARSRE